MKKKIDLERYMGDWYVVANIPTFYEKNAFGSIEGYRLNPDGTIFNYFDSRRGSFNGPLKRITAKAWVTNLKTNAEWKVCFFWPLTFSYQVLEVGADYEYAVVGHPSKRFVWIMSRTPHLEGKLMRGIIGRLDKLGYDTTQIRPVPQKQTRRTQKKAAA